MSSVDNRIVNMQFNNKQFTAGVTESQRSLAGLEQSLAKTGGSAGLQQMADGVEKTTSRFGALKVAGITAIATIANKVTNFGINMAKSLTLDPIAEGFANYETKINAVQTILANTHDQGVKLKDVTKELNILNTYANKTVYNFSQMAKNIGTFTAAGVDLKTSVSSIKGIANLAALSGSSAEQASSAMYQLSQAIAAGQVHLQDWNSVVNAGIGGAVFQKNLIQSALATGTLDKNQVHLGKTMADTTVNGVAFRQSLTPPPGGTSWLTSGVLTKSLSTFTGDMTKAQLVAQGFPKAVAASIVAQGKMASNAATQVKTFTQLFQSLKEEVGTAWAAVFEALFGNINQAKAFLSPLHTTIENALTKPIYAVAEALKSWRKAGGFQDIVNIFENLATIVGNLLSPFKALFEGLFPSAGKATEGIGKGLEGFTKIMAELTGWLVKVSDGIKVLDPIMLSVGKAVRSFVGDIVSLVKAGGQLEPIFAAIGDKLSGVVDKFGTHGAEIAQNLIDGLIAGFNASGLEAAFVTLAHNIISGIEGALGIHSPATSMIPIGINIVAGIVVGIGKGAGLILQAIGVMIKTVFSGIGNLLQGVSPLGIASLINALLAGGLILAFKKMVESITNISGSFEAIGRGFAESLDQVGKSLKVWQSSLKAKMIEEIAIAIGILVASLIALSFVDPKNLAKGIGALAAVMSMMTVMFLTLTKIDTKGSLIGISTSILILSTAMSALAGAVALFGNMDMGTLAKGIGAMAIVLGILIVAMKGLAGLKGQFVAASAGMVLMAFALNIMAGAVALLGNMDMGTLAKGLGAMGIGLGLMMLALVGLSAAGPGVAKSAASIVLVAGAMNIMAGAIAILGNLSMETLAKGIGAMAIGMGLMVVALAALSVGGPSILAGAGGMVLMATAMNLMVGVILTLGSAPWESVAKGLTFVAIALAIFLAAGALAEAVAPGLEALGLAVLAMGAAMFLAGAGMAAFGTGFALLAATGAAGTAVLIGIITALISLLPQIAIQAAAAFVAFVQVIANSTGPLRKAFDTIFKNIIGVIKDNIPVIAKLGVTLTSELLKAITKLVPQFGHLINVMIKTGLDVLTKAVPRYIAAGTTIILQTLKGMSNSVPKIVNTATDLIVRFIHAIGNSVDRIAKAAGDTILKALQAVDRTVKQDGSPIASEMVQIGKDLILGLVRGFGGDWAYQQIKAAVARMTSWIPGPIRKIFGMQSPSKVMMEIGRNLGAGMAIGIRQSIPDVVRAAAQMANAVIAAGSKSVLKAQKLSRAAQNKAYRAAAKADLVADQARAAAANVREKTREQQQAAHFAQQHKKDKQAQERAKALQKQVDAAQKHADLVQKRADASQKHADQIQRQADRAAQHVQNVQTFQQADLHGKGDIRNQQAVSLADRAEKAMAKANVEADRARELMKTNVKAGRAMLKQAQKDAKEAKRLAQQARLSHKEALKYYAQEVDNRIKQLEKDAAADKKAKKEQAAYDAADAQGKSDILTKRADAEAARAKTQHELAKQLMHQAKRLASTDAVKAMKLLDRAEKAAQASKDAADQAAQDRDQAQQVLSEGSSSTGTTNGSVIAPSRTVLEDAAKAIDRYTQSLMEASAMAAAGEGMIQFNQNNYSPEPLSASEVYRQSKNLLSAAQIKMGVLTPP